MELRLLLLLCCCLAALQELNALDQNALKKRAVNEYSSNHKHAEEVEGSGGGPPASSYDVKKKNLAAADIEWEASGIGPDDEDGDVVEGSGDDEVHGSGDGPPPVRIPPVVIQHTTTTATQPPAVNVHDVIRRPPSQEDVHIEEQAPPSVRTTPSRGTYPEMTTAHTPPPSIFEGEQRHATIDTLLKPGILAAIIGGFVVGILAAILLVMFLVYRMRKKDEGSYALDEPKQPPHYSYAYQKAPTKEFYA